MTKLSGLCHDAEAEWRPGQQWSHHSVQLQRSTQNGHQLSNPEQSDLRATTDTLPLGLDKWVSQIRIRSPIKADSYKHKLSEYEGAILACHAT